LNRIKKEQEVGETGKGIYDRAIVQEEEMT